MNYKDIKTALKVLTNMRDRIIENMVDELMRYKDEDPSSFNLQEIEDRFSMRLSNINTLIGTIQDYMIEKHHPEANKIITNVYEITKSKLPSKLNEILEFITPDELLHLSIVPARGEKYLIILARSV